MVVCTSIFFLMASIVFSSRLTVELLFVQTSVAQTSSLEDDSPQVTNRSRGPDCIVQGTPCPHPTHGTATFRESLRDCTCF